ncbi:MAG: extracellular solute-binding protein [Chloroflexi bacterium]|nr:extracellular solute-binding protein [Chloroflexota bacterium]
MRILRRVTPLIVLIALLVVAPAALGQDEFDWRRFEGTELRAIMIQGPWIDSARPFIESFEELTGMTVVLEVLPEAEAWDKIRVEMQANNEDLDIFYNQTQRFGVEFTENGWVQPLNDYIANPELTTADFNWETDFVDYNREGVTFDGQVIGIPTDRQLGPMLFYRKDVLEEYGIEVPTTFEELGAAARQIWEASGNTLPGFVARGQGASATSAYSYVMGEFGAVWQDEEGRPTLNTPEHLAAFTWYGETLRESGSVGATAFAFPETTNEFLTGNAAFTIELGVNPRNISDPAVSSVVDLVGFTVIPDGPGPDDFRNTDPCPPIRPFAVSISTFSPDKEAAWLFIQYITGFEPQLAYLQAGRVAARSAPWSSEEFTSSLNQTGQEYWAAQMEASGLCYPTSGFAPASIIDNGRARDIIGQVIETAIIGGDIEAALQLAQEELDMLYDRQQ